MNGPAWVGALLSPRPPSATRWNHHVPGESGGLVVAVAVAGNVGSAAPGTSLAASDQRYA